MTDQERIIRILTNKKNQRTLVQKPDNEGKEKSHRHREDSVPKKSLTPELEGDKEIEEQESKNNSHGKPCKVMKIQKMELQGEFKKIKPSTFDGRSEEGAKAWLVNIKKYFRIYEYSSNLKAYLEIY